MHCNLQIKQKVPLCTRLLSCPYFVCVTVSWLRPKFRGTYTHVGTQAFHVNSFPKEKECRESALKSTGDLPVKIKHTLGWVVVWSLYMSRLINFKIHNTSIWTFSCLQVSSFPAKWQYACSFFFFFGREIKREYFGYISLTGECANDRNTLKQFTWIKVLFGM